MIPFSGLCALSYVSSLVTSKGISKKPTSGLSSVLLSLPLPQAVSTQQQIAGSCPGHSPISEPLSLLALEYATNLCYLASNGPGCTTGTILSSQLCNRHQNDLRVMAIRFSMLTLTKCGSSLNHLATSLPVLGETTATLLSTTPVLLHQQPHPQHHVGQPRRFHNSTIVGSIYPIYNNQPRRSPPPTLQNVHSPTLCNIKASSQTLNDHVLIPSIPRIQFQ